MTSSTVKIVGAGVAGGVVLTDEQRNEFRTAFRRDLRERATDEAWHRTEERLLAGLQDKECNLKGCHIGTHLSIAISQHYLKSSVERLLLHDNMLMDLGAEAIGQLIREAPSLLTLDVGSNDIGPAGLFSIAQAIETHKRVNTLILGCGDGGNTRTVNRCDAATAKLLFEKAVSCRTLRTLHLNHVDIGAATDGAGGQDALLAAVPLIVGGGANVAALHHLHLGHVGMTTATAVRLIEAVKLGGSLNTLDLHGNNLGAGAGEALGSTLFEKSKRTTVSNLRVLLFQQNPNLNTSPIFAGLAKDRGVTTLNVSRCNVDDLAVGALCAALASNTVLTDIDVSHGKITEVGAVELARGLVRHPCIRRVVLSGNRIKDDGACAMAAVIEHARSLHAAAAAGAPAAAAGSGAAAAAAMAGGGAGSPHRGGAGGGAAGGADGGNVGLEELYLDECWISDRGAVALGVAVASNTSLRTLRMGNNHVSGEAGTALAALLEKNKTLLTCSVAGNTLSHSTASAIERVVERNRAIKADEGPSKLRQDICRLHYNLYKLSEAKAELLQQQKLRDKHAKNVEALDNQLRSEQMEFNKKQKELKDAEREASISVSSLESQMKSMADAFDTFVLQNRSDVAAQEGRLAAEQAERAKAEEELARIQDEVRESTKNRDLRIADLQAKIEEAKRDQRLWMEQTALYRDQLDEAHQRAQELEAMGGGGSARSRRTGESGGESARRRRRSTVAGAGRSRRGRGAEQPNMAAGAADALAALESALSGRDGGGANTAAASVNG